MALWRFWSVGMLIVTSAGVASLETDKFLSLAQGVAQSGLLATKSSPPILPASVVHTAVTVALKPQQTVSQLSSFVHEVDQLWDGDAQFSSPSQLVQYSADKRTRSLIDLKEGKLIVEHLASPDAELVMHRVLTNALLTPDDPRHVDLLSSHILLSDRPPFLFGQVVDSLGKPIDNLAKAQNFAAWAIVNKMQQIQTPSAKVQRIELALDANHKQVRAARFARYIEAAAAEFNLDVNLLYAIMETESSFNPFAVSRTGALGLMQIMPERAGRDAIKVLTGERRTPSYAELFDPQTNIRLGAAYLALLSEHYMKEITDPYSKEMAVIAAYNGGVSRVLSVITNDLGLAPSDIDRLPSLMFYDALKKKLPTSETRNYLLKVTSAKQRYANRV